MVTPWNPAPGRMGWEEGSVLATVSGRGHVWVMLLRSGCLGMGLGLARLCLASTKIPFCREQAVSGDSSCCPRADRGLGANSDSGPACLCL